MRILNRYLIYLLVGLLVSCGTKKSFDSDITQSELFDHIDFLASDSLAGRKPGTPFDRVAAKYIKDIMEQSGLKLLAKNGYQFFEYIDHQDVGSNNFMSVNKQSFHIGDDYNVMAFSSNDTLAAAVIFVGYGFDIAEDTLIWNDYSTVNVSGKWALILRGHPDEENEESLLEDYASDRYKAMLAKDQGAAGVILVSGKKHDPKDELVSAKNKTFDIGIPVVQVSRNLANSILSASDNSIYEIEQKIINDHKPYSFIAGANVCARTDIVKKKRNSQNIVGMIEGKHPELKNQYVVIGAHYDHIGMGGEGTSSRMPDTLAVHNGADDNASGVAAILEIGQKFFKNQPDRSVVIVAFGAEELGLLGSKFFVDNPLFPIDSISAMINIDMLGRLDEEQTLQVGGYKTSLEADTTLNKVNDDYNLNLALAPQGYGPSDHASFYSRNVPVLFFSTGPHTDYHTPNDDISMINFEGLVKTSNFIYDVASQIANMPKRLAFQEAGPAAPSSRHGNELKVRFGIMPDVSGVENNGLRVLAVNANQPAALAGLEKGDIITAINGKKIKNIHDYMYRLQDLEPGGTVSVEFLRNDETKVVLLQL
ncbi:MAG: M20/M25/M40 family metallo-hydrolase [Bacteroidales bacterium]